MILLAALLLLATVGTARPPSRIVRLSIEWTAQDGTTQRAQVMQREGGMAKAMIGKDSPIYGFEPVVIDQTNIDLKIFKLQERSEFDAWGKPNWQWVAKVRLSRGIGLYCADTEPLMILTLERVCRNARECRGRPLGATQRDFDRAVGKPDREDLPPYHKLERP
jgi:hypothetical protein